MSVECGCKHESQWFPPVAHLLARLGELGRPVQIHLRLDDGSELREPAERWRRGLPEMRVQRLQRLRALKVFQCPLQIPLRLSCGPSAHEPLGKLRVEFDSLVRVRFGVRRSIHLEQHHSPVAIRLKVGCVGGEAQCVALQRIFVVPLFECGIPLLLEIESLRLG